MKPGKPPVTTNSKRSATPSRKRQVNRKVVAGACALALVAFATPFCFGQLGVLQGQVESAKSGPQPENPVFAGPKFAEVSTGDTIRVGLTDDAMRRFAYPKARLQSSGKLRLMQNQTVLTEVEPRTEITFTADAEGLHYQLEGQDKPSLAVTSSIQVIAQPGHLIEVPSITRRGKTPRYRGSFEVIQNEETPETLTLVNVLPLEEYLRAVVPNELPDRYGEEAVKAQSVAARNYAIRPREKPWQGFDICDSQYCQVYFGAQTESSVSALALKLTHGQVLLYQGKPALTLYSSAHGGHSESFAAVFGNKETHPYLVSKPDIPDATNQDLSKENDARRFWTDDHARAYDANSPFFRWQRTWTRHELESQLEKAIKEGYLKPVGSTRPETPLGAVQRVEVTRRGSSGKALAVVVNTSTGAWGVTGELNIRRAFSDNGAAMPSANVVFSHLTDAHGRLVSFRAEGGGFGHGVGMSQLGASWLGTHGRDYEDILAHYYPGTELATIPIELAPLDLSVQPEPYVTPDVETERKSPVTSGLYDQANGVDDTPATPIAQRRFYAPRERARLNIAVEMQPALKALLPITLTLRVNDEPMTITMAPGETTKAFEVELLARTVNELEVYQVKVSDAHALIKALGQTSPEGAPATGPVPFRTRLWISL